MASVPSEFRGWKVALVSHLRHPPALWQDLAVQPLYTALFKSFRCLSAASYVHDWDCYFHDKLTCCPEPEVRILVQLFPSCSQAITLLTVPPVPLCLGIFLQLSTSLL